MKKIFVGTLMTLLALLSFDTAAPAQIQSNDATVAVAAELLESLTVTLRANRVSFRLTSGSASNSGDVTIAATTSWTLTSARTGVSLFAYFSSDTAALIHTDRANTIDIPSSRVEVSVNGGPNEAFDQKDPFGVGSAGREIFAQKVSAASDSRTDTLALNVNLAGYDLPADQYTGTLHVRALATP